MESKHVEKNDTHMFTAPSAIVFSQGCPPQQLIEKSPLASRLMFVELFKPAEKWDLEEEWKNAVSGYLYSTSKANKALYYNIITNLHQSLSVEQRMVFRIPIIDDSSADSQD